MPRTYLRLLPIFVQERERGYFNLTRDGASRVYRKSHDRARQSTGSIRTPGEPKRSTVLIPIRRSQFGFWGLLGPRLHLPAVPFIRSRLPGNFDLSVCVVTRPPNTSVNRFSRVQTSGNTKSKQIDDKLPFHL